MTGQTFMACGGNVEAAMHAWCPSIGAAIADSIPDSSSRRTQRSQSAIQLFLDSFRKVFVGREDRTLES